MNYTEHFGEQSADYLRFRPDYPNGLYRYLARLVNEHLLVWDCGTGNGQAAVKLADYFTKVIATDVNQAQLEVAIKKENIFYYPWSAEKTDIPNHSVNLITVAQALHWFNFDNFFSEVRRVAKPNALIAAWCYSLGTINDEIDAIISKLYVDILGDAYWPKERKYIDEEYKTIPFPFKKIESPHFRIEKKVSLEQLIGYLNTWSAVKEYQKQKNTNPLEIIYPELECAWGNLKNKYIMHWPLHLLVGHIN